MLHTKYYNRIPEQLTEADLRLGSHVRALGPDGVSDMPEYDPDPAVEAEFSFDWKEAVEDCGIEAGVKVLEVGAGFGQVTCELIELGAKVTVVEPSMYRAKILDERFKGLGLDIYVCDLANLRIDEKFDFVLVHDICRIFRMRMPLKGVMEPHLAHGEELLSEDGELFVLAGEDEDIAAGYDGLRGDFRPEGRTLPVDEDRELVARVLDVQLSLLRELVRVCEENGLSYYMMYGTLLGAVRVAGVIPGDDDIDIAMPRADYDKLAGLSDAFGEGVFLQTPQNDNAFYGGYLKLHDTRTTCIRVETWNVDPCEGISIDIFPIDKCYADEEKEERKRWWICQYQRMLFAYSYGYSRRFRDMPLLVWKFYKYLGKLTSKEKVIERLRRMMSAGDEDCGKVAVYAHYQAGKGARYMPAWDGAVSKASSESGAASAGTVILSFEGMRLPAPANWDEVLSALYGPSYDRPVPWSLHKLRHGFYDTDHPYGYYKEKFTRMYRSKGQARDVVLLGDACMFADYEKFDPAVNVVARVQIEDDAVLFGCVPDSKYVWYEDWVASGEAAAALEAGTQVVVIAVDLRLAEEFAKKAGITDYAFYTHDKYDIMAAEPSGLWLRYCAT